MNLLKESSLYQLILAEQAKGRLKEQLEEARKLLIRLGRIRLGRLPKGTRVAIESIDDLERLEGLLERTFSVSTWAELLAESE